MNGMKGWMSKHNKWNTCMNVWFNKGNEFMTEIQMIFFEREERIKGMYEWINGWIDEINERKNEWMITPSND